MKNIRVNKKALKITAALAAILLTATILTAATTIQNQNQNAYPLLNAYLMGFSPSPNNAIILPKYDITTSITLNGGVYTETMNVLASNIVIDGNGSTIQGPGTNSGDGFDLTVVSNVTIFNVTVTGWNIGFDLESNGLDNLTNNTANNNGFAGFYLLGGSNNTFTNNTANNNQDGFYLYFSSYNTFTNNTANNNGFAGFWLLSGSDNSILSNNTANNNTNTGFYLESSNNNLSNNTAKNNGNGLIIGVSNNTLSGNLAENNLYDGFFLDYQSHNNTLSGNIAINDSYGFEMHQSANYNTLSSNTAINNTMYGFDLYVSQYCNLTNNTVINCVTGFNLFDNSSFNNLLGNNVLNSTAGYSWDSYSNNNNYTDSVWANYLRVNVTNSLGLPITGAEVNVVTNGTPVYATPHFGGSNSTTDSNGLTPWIVVTVAIGTGIDQMTFNTTNATVYYAHLPFSSNPRTVNMSASHVETFQEATPTITSPSASAVLPTNITVNWTGPLPGISYSVKLDAGSWISVGASNSYPLTGLSNGTHTVYVGAFDSAGNNATDSVSFNVDTTPPTVSTTSPSNGALFNTASVAVNWTGSDDTGIDHYEARIDSGSWINVGTALSHAFNGLSDGNHTAYVMAFDLASNNANASVNFTVDTTPPSVNITSPSSSATLNTGNVTVNWTGSDATSGISYCEVRNDSGSWINVGTNTSYAFINLTIGTHTVDVRAWDLAGNNATASVNFTVSSGQPALSQAMLLALLSFGMQGTSPMVYGAIVGVVGVVVVAAGLYYYFRRVQA